METTEHRHQWREVRREERNMHAISEERCPMCGMSRFWLVTAWGSARLPTWPKPQQAEASH